MIKISILTLFPQLFYYFKKTSILGKKIKKKIIKMKLIKIKNKLGYKKIDKKPYNKNTSKIIEINFIIKIIKKIKNKEKKKK